MESHVWFIFVRGWHHNRPCEEYSTFPPSASEIKGKYVTLLWLVVTHLIEMCLCVLKITYKRNDKNYITRFCLKETGTFHQMCTELLFVCIIEIFSGEQTGVQKVISKLRECLVYPSLLYTSRWTLVKYWFKIKMLDQTVPILTASSSGDQCNLCWCPASLQYHLIRCGIVNMWSWTCSIKVRLIDICLISIETDIKCKSISFSSM